MLRIVTFTTAAVALSACAAGSPAAMQLAQERQACAEQGIAPGSAQFDTCVGNLDATMTDLSSPANR